MMLLLFNTIWVCSLSTMLAISEANPNDVQTPHPSSYWTLEQQRADWWPRRRQNDQQHRRRASSLVTVGRYSEREGDRDMLKSTPSGNFGGMKMPSGQQQQHQQILETKWMVDQPMPMPLMHQLDDAASSNSRWQQQQQQAVPLSSSFALFRDQPQQQQQQLPRPIQPFVASGSEWQPPRAMLPSAMAASPHALDRFATDLHRFASSAPASPEAAINRVVLPPGLVERLRNGISLDSIAQNPPRLMGEPASTVAEPKPKFNGIGGPADGSMAGSWSSDEKPKTVILTNERVPVPPEDAHVRQVPGPAELSEGSTMLKSGNEVEDQVPSLSEFRHEDIRPATGDRLGPQAKFAGQTNEYREDWGRELTRPEDQREKPSGPRAEYFGPTKFAGGEGPASRLAGSGINPAPVGARIVVGGGQNVGESTPTRAGLVRGRLSPYLNAPEEITGSRFRNMDEHFNALNGGNRGRGPNRYVKMDLLNE